MTKIGFLDLAGAGEASSWPTDNRRARQACSLHHIHRILRLADVLREMDSLLIIRVESMGATGNSEVIYRSGPGYHYE